MNPGQKQATRGLFGGVMTTGNKKEILLSSLAEHLLETS